MPVVLEPLRRFCCTYNDCFMSFDTEKAMKSHKKYSDEHDYCHKCDEDFDSYDDYAYHKIIRPDEHGKACRVCGDEFKSESGLKRHIELNHKVDQKLVCIGCHKSFYRACLFLEHLEFNHCEVITSKQFEGHVVHKHLVTELLKGGAAYERFQQKISKYEAAIDHEEEGGVSLEDDPLGGDVDEEVKFEALQPDEPVNTPMPADPYPPLPTRSKVASDTDSVTFGFDSLSLAGTSEISTTVGLSPSITLPIFSSPSSRAGSTAQLSSLSTLSRQSKAWGDRNGRSAINVLFPNAKPTPVPSEFSIAAYDEAREENNGLNIMRNRFWDPLSTDFNVERFYNAITSKYSCPFICDQTFLCVSDVQDHILSDHRITRMKCPTCLKYFKSATALMSHCESRGSKCQVNRADDFNMFLDRLSGGFLGVEEKVRPDHMNNPQVLLQDSRTGRMERYKPPVASYLQYMVTKPPDWKEPVSGGVQIDGMPRHGRSPW